MRVLLTGATGYLGGRVLQALGATNFEVFVLVRRRVELPACHTLIWDGHCESLAPIIEQTKPDVVINLAAESVAHPSLSRFDAMVAANLQLPLGLLESMKVLPRPSFIQAASYWQIADNATGSPLSTYALTKEMTGIGLDFYCKNAGFAAISLLLGDMIGPRDPRPKLLPSLIEAYRTGKTLEMTQGEQLMYPVDIDDVAAAFLRSIDMLTSGLHQKYLVLGKPVTVRGFVDEVASAWGRPAPAAFGARPATGAIFNKTIDCLPRFPIPISPLKETLMRIKKTETP